MYFPTIFTARIFPTYMYNDCSCIFWLWHQYEGVKTNKQTKKKTPWSKNSVVQIKKKCSICYKYFRTQFQEWSVIDIRINMIQHNILSVTCDFQDCLYPKWNNFAWSTKQNVLLLFWESIVCISLRVKSMKWSIFRSKPNPFEVPFNIPQEQTLYYDI